MSHHVLNDYFPKQNVRNYFKAIIHFFRLKLEY
jgi:hypothetical protein